MPAETLERLLTVEEAADVLGMQPITVRRHIKAGRLVGVKMTEARQGDIRIEPAAIRAFIAERRTKPPQSAQS